MRNIKFCLGTYSTGGATKCTVCPAGSKCPNPLIAAAICDDGSWSPSGSGTCTQCARGWKCPKADGTGNEQCQLVRTISHYCFVVDCGYFLHRWPY